MAVSIFNERELAHMHGLPFAAQALYIFMKSQYDYASGTIGVEKPLDIDSLKQILQLASQADEEDLAEPEAAALVSTCFDDLTSAGMLVDIGPAAFRLPHASSAKDAGSPERLLFSTCLSFYEREGFSRSASRQRLKILSDKYGRVAVAQAVVKALLNYPEQGSIDVEYDLEVMK